MRCLSERGHVQIATLWYPVLVLLECPSGCFKRAHHVTEYFSCEAPLEGVIEKSARNYFQQCNTMQKEIPNVSQEAARNTSPGAFGEGKS